eukprot:CAMPEP_0175071476 /NCGR_PEP_ID=MMETSP0052_2-20121109/19267_1 /TAXON_ID=51329 ORGANISM="Polytomella parva, Strain SAG 63-3" /NCGR_SAMPLE_ID=MMETSP0052_2 /ASSEMBLY_ACC=CAM_ASM_000194 /LENGTH=80 /DNA_ID=CAMNT_0016338657 /DNA_START=120 /DNA_END=362 /DNA_ORIENTATION=-
MSTNPDLTPACSITSFSVSSTAPFSNSTLRIKETKSGSRLVLTFSKAGPSLVKPGKNPSSHDDDGDKIKSRVDHESYNDP